jgi:DNA-binding response OmpR family regulator
MLLRMPAPPIVIIAEPDPRISSILRVEFSHWDFAVFLASSGLEAEEYAAHAVAQLIVLDTKLHLGAYDACARIRRRAGYATKPIVLTANEISPTLKMVAAKVGATVLLPKPYSVAGLFGAIRPFLSSNDLLLTHRARGPGMSQAREWMPAPPPNMRSGGDSALTRNAQLLPIVRSQGVAIPLVRNR